MMCLCTPVLSAAYADVTEKDLRAFTRAMGFMKPTPSGDVDFAVLYNPQNTESAQDAKTMMRLLSKGYKAGRAKLTPRLVSTANISSLNNADFVYVTLGLSSWHGKISNGRKALVLSLDKSCVEKGDCMLYVNTQNRVEILVNKKAASAADIEFKPVFMAMVKTL